MSKIGIIGVGHVGATLAYTLISRQIADELVLFDKDPKIVPAETNDLIDGQVDRNGFVTIRPSNIEELADCDILVLSAGRISVLKETEDRFAELNITSKIVEEWAPKIKNSGFNGIILVISNPCDVITRYMQELTGFPKERVFGTGTSLDTARMQHAVSNKLSVHPNNVNGYVLGEHGITQFTAWSGVVVASIPIEELLGSSDLKQLEDDARQGGWTTFNGKGYTSYGIANQAALICEAILTDSQLIKPVSTYSDAEDLYIGLPAKITKHGVVENYPQVLSIEEKEKWNTSVQRIEEMYEAIEKN